MLIGLFIPAIAIPSFAFDDSAASLAVHFVDGQTRFPVGEAVPIELEFSTSLPNAYEISNANYDRSGLMNLEQLHVVPLVQKSS